MYKYTATCTATQINIGDLRVRKFGKLWLLNNFRMVLKNQYGGIEGIEDVVIFSVHTCIMESYTVNIVYHYFEIKMELCSLYRKQTTTRTNINNICKPNNFRESPWSVLKVSPKCFTD